MKKYTHGATGRVAWAMRITEAMFASDAARPESDGLVYDGRLATVRAFSADKVNPRSSGGVGAWVVEVVPGHFDVLAHDDFTRDYLEWRAGPYDGQAPEIEDARRVE